MSIEQCEARMNASSSIGTKMHTLVEETMQQKYRIEGAASALVQLLKEFDVIQGNIDKEFEAKKFDASHQQLAKQAVGACSISVKKFLGNLQDEQKKNIGKMEALESSLTLVKSAIDEEKKRIDDLKNPEKNKEDLVGEHPGKSLSTKRKEEAATKPPVVAASFNKKKPKK